jgi:hypothetical protein
MNKLYYTECRIYLHVYTVKPVLRGRIWDKENVTL